MVQPGVYRFESPQSIHLPFIHQLKLTSALLLTPEQPSHAALQYFAENNIQLVHVGLLHAWKQHDWQPCSDELVKESLEWILDAHHHPVAIMCTSGVHETGIVVGCLRKLSGWNLTSILIEYRHFAQTKARNVHEQFIELYDLDLVN
jgi:hypothetical protein